MERYEESQKEELYLKVNGENKVNSILNKVVPGLLKAFEGLEGKQIFKAGYSVTNAELLKKYKDQTDRILKEFEELFNIGEEVTTNLYLNCSEYSVYLNIKLRFNNVKKDGFLYYDGQKYILNCRNGKLLNFYEFKPFEKIDADEQYKIFLRCNELNKQLKDEKNKLNPYSLVKLVRY